MKKTITLFLCCTLSILCLFQATYATDSIKIINTKEDFYHFMSNGSPYVTAKLNNEIRLDSSVFSHASKDIDMNGYSIIIPRTSVVCFKASEGSHITSFHNNSDNPVFIVEGVLELYAGKLTSSSNDSLIKIKDNGKLYTRNPLVDDKYYDNDKGIDIGRPSIYDKQLVKLNIPNGTAIEGGKEEAYYHLDINAKTVIQSTIQPTFYYSSIKSKQNIAVKQGVYNDTLNMKNIPIFKHQLIMAIDDSVTSDSIEYYLPKEIVTKDNQYITVHFDTSTFNDSLSEQTLYGEYHNINDLFLPYLPKLELKIIKNQKVPLSQLYTTFAAVSSLSDTGMLSPNAISPQLLLHINYTNANQIFLQEAFNIDFINCIETEIDTYGYSYPISKQAGSISSQESRYFRIHVTDGLQEGYSNIIKIDQWQMVYAAEPESTWVEDDIEDLPIVVPPLGTGNDTTDTPDSLPNDGSGHRNDTSIDEPKDKSEVVIVPEESASNIKAEEDILVNLKNHQVTIPYETAKKHVNSNIIVKENEEGVKITSNNKPINDSNIQITNQTKNDYYVSYIGYTVVGVGVILSVIYFFKFQKRGK